MLSLAIAAQNTPNKPTEFADPPTPNQFSITFVPSPTWNTNVEAQAFFISRVFVK